MHAIPTCLGIQTGVRGSIHTCDFTAHMSDMRMADPEFPATAWFKLKPPHLQ